MNLEIFSSVNKVDYPSIRIKNVKLMGNSSNVNNGYFLEHERIKVYNNWKCFPKVLKAKTEFEKYLVRYGNLKI